MPYATLCPICSYCWTLVEAVAASWPCPKCHTYRSEGAQTLCRCTHTYAQHQTSRRIENSLVAFTIATNQCDDTIDALPESATMPEALGKCGLCHCSAYEIDDARRPRTAFSG